MKVYRDVKMPGDQLKAWQRDRQGAIISDSLAVKYGWKIGDRIVIVGDIYPVTLELYVRRDLPRRAGPQVALLQY